MTQQDLKKLRAATNDAIGVIETWDDRPREPVNWADLRCVQAAWVVTDEGESYAEVTIEEAAPECPQFQAAVARELEKLGWPGVRVVTEW